MQVHPEMSDQEIASTVISAAGTDLRLAGILDLLDAYLDARVQASLRTIIRRHDEQET